VPLVRAGLRIAIRGSALFNADGATKFLWRTHDPETHLIPIVLQAAAGQRSNVEIFGMIIQPLTARAFRDYIHVSDLARAHVLAWIF